jgi:hypothetical protein
MWDHETLSWYYANGKHKQLVRATEMKRFAIALGILTTATVIGSANAAEMPKDFRGTWCASSDTIEDDWSAYEGADCPDGYSSLEITATRVNIPALSMSCVVRQVAKYDVCPWGMIFRSRERARALRSSQINPWSPGYHIVLQCTRGSSKQSEAKTDDWVIEKGSIRVGITRDYRCPWDRRRVR